MGNFQEKVKNTLLVETTCFINSNEGAAEVLLLFLGWFGSEHPLVEKAFPLLRVTAVMLYLYFKAINGLFPLNRDSPNLPQFKLKPLFITHS